MKSDSQAHQPNNNCMAPVSKNVYSQNFAEKTKTIVAGELLRLVANELKQVNHVVLTSERMNQIQMKTVKKRSWTSGQSIPMETFGFRDT